MEGLKGNLLFKGIKDEDIYRIFDNIRYSINSYKKNEIIAHEDDRCYALGLILEGGVEIQRLFPSGKYIVLSKLFVGDVFGEALVFLQDSFYPATVVASKDSKILFLNKDEVLKICLQESKFLENFMSLLSSKVLMLNEKIRTVSYKTVREKVVNYLLKEYKQQNSINIELRESKEDIAAYLGIPRPSLSREFMKLKEEGVIDYNRKSVILLKKIELEDMLDLIHK